MLRFPRMRLVVAALLLVLLTSPLAADDAPPFLGVEGLDVLAARDRSAAALEPLSGLQRCFVRTAPIPWGQVDEGRWDALDEAVLLWQLSGFDPVPVLTPRSAKRALDPARSAWHAQVRAALPAVQAQAVLRDATGCTPPQPQAWTQWERFVRDVVERYDGDGTDDMPGLRRPLRHIQVLDRIATPEDWLGSADDYMRLLHHAGLGAKAAHADTQVVTAAIDMRAIGHDPYPDAREWEFRVKKLYPKNAPLAELEVTRSFEIAHRVLETPRLYDAIAHRGSDNHTDDVANIRFLRRRLDERGGKDVRIWLVDNPARKLGAAKSPGAVEPQEDEQRLRHRWMPPALQPAHSEHKKALPWMRRGQALDLVRTACLARAAGADVVCLNAAWDAMPGTHPERFRRRQQGLVDASGARTPSWFVLDQVARHLNGHRAARLAELGAPGSAVVFTFDDDSKLPWISVLLLDQRLTWAGTPGEALPKRKVAVPLPNGEYVLESGRLGEAQPDRREVAVTQGILELELTPAPTYVIPKQK